MKSETLWKVKYLRILVSGPAGEEDYSAAGQLINEGYAAGQHRPSRGREGIGPGTLNWGGATIDGRLFADRLAEEIMKSSLAQRLRVAATHFLAWLAGIATALSPEIFKMFFPI